MEAHVAIVDCGGANIASLSNALNRLGASSELTNDVRAIRNASHVILPGVGAAADAMQRIEENDLASVITGLEQPVLGICLGMQLLAGSSAEDNVACLGVVPGSVRKLQATLEAPVPNIGWCRVQQTDAHAMFAGIDTDSYFYFVHSFALPAGEYTIATANHSTPFSAAFARHNFIAAQFHPERSAASGARFLKNFLEEAA
ncbi:MAG: imidazole glycerol phosphate synthase subunit HisH [Woeseiaceae bacterium]|nr:imidazole glycerol phosphate synthase subunit HisH [Woeseiaceae bacterium]